jgi:hypothetical protein
LVVNLDNDAIGIELKVFAASARKGQLASQYFGLHHVTPNEKNVHIVLIFPSSTSLQNDTLRGDEPESKG